MRRSSSIRCSASIARCGSGQRREGVTMSTGDPSKTTHGLVDAKASLSRARAKRARSLVKVFCRTSESAPLRSTTTPRSCPSRT
jgi:hypothetical protein